MTISNREKVEAEADELYPQAKDGVELEYPIEALRFYARRAHVRARTVTAEQVEAAAKVMHEMQMDTLWGESESERAADLEVQREAFRAAGLIVEGDE